MYKLKGGMSHKGIRIQDSVALCLGLYHIWHHQSLLRQPLFKEQLI